MATKQSPQPSQRRLPVSPQPYRCCPSNKIKGHTLYSSSTIHISHNKASDPLKRWSCDGKNGNLRIITSWPHPLQGFYSVTEYPSWVKHFLIGWEWWCSQISLMHIAWPSPRCIRAISRTHTGRWIHFNNLRPPSCFLATSPTLLQC